MQHSSRRAEEHSSDAVEATLAGYADGKDRQVSAGAVPLLQTVPSAVQIHASGFDHLSGVHESSIAGLIEI